MNRGITVDYSGQPHILLELSEREVLLYHRFVDEGGGEGYPEVLDEEQVLVHKDLIQEGGRFVFWVERDQVRPWVE